MSLPRPILRFAIVMLPILTVYIGLFTTTIQAAEQPNVIVILTDDQGWGDLSLNGNLDLETPNIDSLARDGASFDRFYVCPVCSPTRAEFLTGRYHSRSGVYSTSAGGERIDLDEWTIAQAFKKAGYATGAFGKWHNGMQYPYHPCARGFDEYYGFCSGHWGDYFSPPLEHNGRIVKGDGFIIDDLTNRAMSYIEACGDRPFFVYLPLNTPHSPMQVPDRFWEKFKDKELKSHNRYPNKENSLHMRCALAMCENIDWNVGRILKKLDELDIADDTIIMYFCDNGPNGNRYNGGMKGRKGSTDEGGVRSPMVIRWPGNIAAGRKVMKLGAAIDLLPTLADLAGIECDAPNTLDGKSLKSLLMESSDTIDPAVADRMIFSHWKGRTSVRTQQYRLDNTGKLYDMHADPGQDKNVAADHPEVTAKLAAAVENFKKEVVAGQGGDDRAFPLGHADFRYTQIPARDGVTTGGVKRSNRFPNCSYFLNWTSTDDRITWDTDVLESGKYEVEIHYACPAADVGSTIELSCGESRLEFKVAKAHDPPARGNENDRSPRTESLVKDFKSMKIGTIELTKGRKPLTLRALKIPGSQAMEVRLLFFTRVE